MYVGKQVWLLKNEEKGEEREEIGERRRREGGGRVAKEIEREQEHK